MKSLPTRIDLILYYNDKKLHFYASIKIYTVRNVWNDVPQYVWQKLEILKKNVMIYIFENELVLVVLGSIESSMVAYLIIPGVDNLTMRVARSDIPP